MVKFLKACLVGGALLIAAIPAARAGGHVSVSVGIHTPPIATTVHYGHPRVYVAPAPVIYAPAPVVYHQVNYRDGYRSDGYRPHRRHHRGEHWRGHRRHYHEHHHYHHDRSYHHGRR